MGKFAVTPDNRFVVFPNPEHYGDFIVADFETMAQIQTIKLRSGSHRAIGIISLPDSQHVVIHNHDAYHDEEDTLRVFDLLTGECVSECNCEGVGSPLVMPEGQVIFTTESGHSVAIWDWQTGSKAQILFYQSLEEGIIETLNSDRSKVVITHYPAKILPFVKEHHRPPTLRIWDLLTGLKICSFPGYKSAAALPDKNKIMTIAEKTGTLTAIPGLKK